MNCSSTHSPRSLKLVNRSQYFIARISPLKQVFGSRSVPDLGAIAALWCLLWRQNPRAPMPLFGYGRRAGQGFGTREKARPGGRAFEFLFYVQNSKLKGGKWTSPGTL